MKSIINILLLITAIIGILIIGGLSFIYSVIDLFFSVSIGRFAKIGVFCKEIAIILDISGGFICKRPFNVLLLHSNSKDHFGESFHTISYILGINLCKSTLTPIGVYIVKFLDLFEKNHCIKAVESYNNNLKNGTNNI